MHDLITTCKLASPENNSYMCMSWGCRRDMLGCQHAMPCITGDLPGAVGFELESIERKRWLRELMSRNQDRCS